MRPSGPDAWAGSTVRRIVPDIPASVPGGRKEEVPRKRRERRGTRSHTPIVAYNALLDSLVRESQQLFYEIMKSYIALGSSVLPSR